MGRPKSKIEASLPSRAKSAEGKYKKVCERMVKNWPLATILKKQTENWQWRSYIYLYNRCGIKFEMNVDYNSTQPKWLPDKEGRRKGLAGS